MVDMSRHVLQVWYRCRCSIRIKEQFYVLLRTWRLLYRAVCLDEFLLGTLDCPGCREAESVEHAFREEFVAAKVVAETERESKLVNAFGGEHVVDEEEQQFDRSENGHGCNLLNSSPQGFSRRPPKGGRRGVSGWWWSPLLHV